MKFSILIADDERENREVLGEVFERQGYRVKLAPDGLAAVSIVFESMPRLAILDYDMPGMNGLDALRTLRSRSVTMPVLLMTSCLTDDLRHEAETSGADDFFEKPVDLGRMRRRVLGLIGEERAMTVYQTTTTIVVRRNL